MPITSSQFRKVLENKKENEPVSVAIRRLQRAQRIGSIRPPKGRSPITKSVIKDVIHRRDMMVSPEALEQLERELWLILDFAIKACRIDSRKTLKAGDVTGASVSIRNRR